MLIKSFSSWNMRTRGGCTRISFGIADVSSTFADGVSFLGSIRMPFNGTFSVSCEDSGVFPSMPEKAFETAHEKPSVSLLLACVSSGF